MSSPEGGSLNWFYVRDGRRVGPFHREPLIAQLLALDAPEAVLVWRTGLPAWTKAGLLDELRGELPPPVPGSLPGGYALEVPASDSDVSADPAAKPLPPLPGEAPMSDGDFAGDLGETGRHGPEGSPEGGDAEPGRRRKRRRHHRPSGPGKIPDYLLPLVLLFLAVMVGLWFLLRRMNEPPPGQILHQGSLAPTDSLPGAFRA